MLSRLTTLVKPALKQTVLKQSSQIIVPCYSSIESKREYHMTTQANSPILFVGLAVAGTALAARYVVLAADSYKNRTDGKSTMAFSKFYEGGFEDPMTKREAALILGVRVNADTQRIQSAYKKLLLKNHPDKGGSPYIASKINQAKDLLLGNTQ